MSRMTQGKERFAQWGWLWNRTKRLADLLLHPHILAGAVQLVEGLDRWCAMNEVDESRVAVDQAIFVKGLDYIEMPLVVE